MNASGQVRRVAVLWPELIVLLAAFVPRLGYVLGSKPGLAGAYGYDSGVYYAAADALVHGRVPYRDYVLLHPPGIALAVAPFAWLGDLTTDHRGFIVANLAFTLLGAVNAVLVVRVARRFGFEVVPASAGGLTYALWFGSINAECLIRLEPLGNCCLLLGLLAFTRLGQSSARRWPVLAGLGFGAAAAVKIWWVLPFVVVAGWFLLRARRQLPAFVAGAAGAAVAICGPFFALAPIQMWRMVIEYQVGRPPFASEANRLPGLTGFNQFSPGFALRHDVLVVTVAAVLVLAICGFACRIAGGPLLVTLLVLQTFLLAAAPSWFPFYDDYLAPALALTVAAAASVVLRDLATGQRPDPRSLRVGGALTAFVVTVGLIVAAIQLPTPVVYPYPHTKLAADVRHVPCVMSDSPMALIELDALSRGFEHGCQNWVDITGRTYGGADAEAKLSDGQYVPRKDDARWQHDLTNYLFSGDAITLLRVANTGIGPKLWHKLRRLPVLARVDKIVVFATHSTAGNHP